MFYVHYLIQDDLYWKNKNSFIHSYLWNILITIIPVLNKYNINWDYMRKFIRIGKR